ncbi:MAG: AAA family ATPase, partial [Solirubrobacteraceae bacterium]
MLPGLEHHPHARAILGAACKPGAEPSHAYLFEGPPGTGKAGVARALAAQLLAPDDPEAAGRVERGTHPDLVWVQPSGAAEMLVSDIDEPVVLAATRTPFEAQRRVFVLEDADAMNDTAANRLLKTLDEPAPHAHLLLLTARPAELLETIRSRCQSVRFDALPANELARQLETEGAPAPIAAACSRLALGDGRLA